MNIATITVRPLTPGSLVSRATPFVIPLPDRRIVVLLIAIMLSALALLYVKDLNRRLFVTQQELHKNTHFLEVEHGKLMLEAGALTAPARIRQIATKELHMQALTPKQAVIIYV